MENILFKNMDKNLVIFTIAALLIVVGLCGCSESEKDQINNDEEKLIGTWINTSLYEGNEMTISYTFYSNSTYVVSRIYLEDTMSFNGTWEVEDNKLIVTIEGRTQTGNIKFSNSEKTITITDLDSGGTTTLTKQ